MGCHDQEVNVGRDRRTTDGKKKIAIPRKKFRVFFEQINQTYVDVIATDELAARKFAEVEWRKHNRPRVVGVE